MTTRAKFLLFFLLASIATTGILAVGVGLSISAQARNDAGRLALSTAELTLRVLQQQQDGKKQASVVYRDVRGKYVMPDSLLERLEVIPGYVGVLRDTSIVYASSAMRMLYVNPATLAPYDSDDWRTLREAMLQGTESGFAAVYQLSDREVILTSLDIKDSAMQVTRIVTGTTVTKRWTREMITAFVVALVAIAIAGWLFWAMLGGLFGRVSRVRAEVSAITDGRSLHRRLSADEAGPELSAIIETLNAMIARLETSFVALRRFTADASHELKTPLAVLRADVERAMHDKTNKGDRLIALEEALHETTRMTDLVESLLTLARADEGRFALHREPVDLGALAQEVYETALILGEAAKVDVTLPFTAEATVMGDRARLRQLFLNLIVNAIKYTPRGGKIELGLGRHPTNVTFAVRDTGIGIAAADLPHIFERFWRADRVRTRTAERGGVGLGLAISQWIAQAHHGTLTVSSRLGRGSLFTVTLPLSEEFTES